MKHSDYLKKKKIRETRKKIISVISAIVVFITTYALVLPAITLDVSKASQEPGIAYEQMQFKATAAAASVTAADSTVEEAQVEEPAAEEPEEEPAEEIKEEEPAETPEEEASAVFAEEEEEEEPEEEAPAEPEQEEAPAQEAPEVQEDKSEADSADEKSSEPAPKKAEDADTEKTAEDTAVDQSGTAVTDAAAAATTAETAAEFKIPELDALDFDDILTGKTNFYYYHVENAEDAEEISSDSIDDWKKVGSDTVLAPEDFVRVYLAYEIPAGALNETNAVARYTLPAGLELSDKQIEAINKYENGIAASKSGSEQDKYLGAEAIEGSRTPDEKVDDEYIAATVKVKKTDNGRQELVFTFIPYTVEKNQISYDEKGQVTGKGKEVKGFFTFDLKTSQIDFEKTNIETVENEDGTTEEIQYSEAKVVFADKDSNWIERALALAGPVEKEERQTAEPKTLTSEGSDYTVTVSYTDEAQIPDNAELAVREIEKDTDEYASYLEQAKGAVDNTKSVNEARFFDITILVDGEKVEPQAPVNVQITFTGIEQTNTDDTQLLHYKDDKEVEVMDQAEFSKSEEPENETKAVDTVQFETDGFSVYGIVGTEVITTEFLSHDGTKYEVTVTYGPEAKIPEGSTLSVTDIDEGTEAYEYARNAVLADKQAKGEEVFLPEFGFAALDISILNPEGEEIEPEAPVQVDIKIKSLPNVENLNDVADTIEIQHHVETGDKVVVDTVYDGGSTEAKFDVATNETAIAAGTAVDPSKYEPEESKGLNSLDEIITSFETDAFSTYTISWGNRSYNIHYVDTNGRSLTPTRTPEFSNGYKFLIYDVDGYEYDSTHYGSRTGTAIKPLLANYGNDRVYLDNNNNWQYLRNDIYVVYKAKTATTTGGTPEVDQDETWPDQEDPARKPQFTKSSTNNGNNTNNISLTITGPEKPVENSTPADVIVIFDVSGSMGSNMNGQNNAGWSNGQYTYWTPANEQRLALAKTAVNTMANSLLNGSNSDVRMALVSFSTTATTVPASGEVFTDDYSTFSGRVNNLTASGGTNWEQALQLANTLPVREDAATFVVFVTDGDPTFRVSRGDVSDSNLDLYTDGTYNYYRNNYVFGEGNDDSNGRNFSFAVNQVSSIAGANKNFYAIGISNDVTKVQTLTTQGGVAADHAFIASDNAAMERAFKSITDSIKSVLGFGNVEVTDGITALTNAEMKVMQSVDPNSFKYYRYGGENNKYGNGYANKTEWTTRAADGCAAASYSSTDGAVHWDMGESFQLENDVTYVVEFTVWPSQTAYDLVSDLNNGIKTYNSLTPEEKAQIVEVTAPTETTTGTYALKTNTDKVEATYNRTTKTGDTVSVSDTTDVLADYHEGTIQNMALDDSFVTITKEWINVIPGDTREARTVNLAVTKDNVTYISPIILSEDNDWTSGKEYISAGLITHVSGTTGRYTIREAGHEYTVSEPAEGDNGYYWDLTADIYRPMVIDGTLHVLIKTSNPTGTEGTDYYVIGNNSYQVRDGQTNLTATNNRRSVLDLSKEVIKEEGAADNPDPNTLFTYTITITGSDGADIWFSAQDKDGATVAIPTTSSNVVAEMGTDGNPTGYYYVPSGAVFTITMKADWTVRFINLPNGTTYSIEETGVGEGYEFVEANTSVTNTSGENLGTPGTVNGDVVTGTIDKPNNEFDVDYKNKWLTKQIQIIKVDENGENLADATFSLTRGHESIATFTSKSNEGEILSLGKGTYCLTETAAPDGYIILSNKIYFNVNTDGTVTLSDEEGETEGITYENAEVSNPPDTELGTVTVSNEPGAALPNTGGTGTLPYTLGGIALIMASALMYGFRMRRRERRLS